MSDRKRFLFDEAMRTAEGVRVALEPFCERIVIAGSLRRRKADVGDMELLYIPRFEDRPADLFSTEPVNLVDEMLNRCLASGVITKRLNAGGGTAWGQWNKLAVDVASGIPLDLFATTADRWWVSLVIRTGSKETNLALTMGAQKLGRTLNAYGSGVTEVRTGAVIPAHSEQEVFALCGVPYKEPMQR